MTEWLDLLVPALARALLHFLWQGALVGLLAWLGLALLRNARPQARYALACLALLACALFPLIDLILGLRSSGFVLSPLATQSAVAPSRRPPRHRFSIPLCWEPHQAMRWFGSWRAGQPAPACCRCGYCWAWCG